MKIFRLFLITVATVLSFQSAGHAAIVNLGTLTPQQQPSLINSIDNAGPFFDQYSFTLNVDALFTSNVVFDGITVPAFTLTNTGTNTGITLSVSDVNVGSLLSKSVSSVLIGPGSYSFDIAGLAQTDSGYIGSLTVGNPVSVTAIPEPQTYAMFLAGLGLLGFASRRRQK